LHADSHRSLCLRALLFPKAGHVFAAVTEPGPIHKPGGKDAEATTRMTGRQKRQEFLDQLLAMFNPRDREAGFPQQREIAMRLSEQ